MPTPASSPASVIRSAAAPSLRAGWYAVAVLWLAYICSFVDRQVLALLVEPIKGSLALDDTGLSLLQGLAFGLFSLVSDTFHSNINWLASRGIFGFSSMSENS